MRASDWHSDVVEPDAQLYLHIVPKGVYYQRNTNRTPERNGFSDLMVRIRDALILDGCDLRRPSLSVYHTNYLAIVQCESALDIKFEDYPVNSFRGTIIWQTVEMAEARLPGHLRRFLPENRLADHESRTPRFSLANKRTLVHAVGSMRFLQAMNRQLLDPEKPNQTDFEGLVHGIAAHEISKDEFRDGVASRIGVNLKKDKKERDAERGVEYFVDNVRTYGDEFMDQAPKVRGKAIAISLGLPTEPRELAPLTAHSRF